MCGNALQRPGRRRIATDYGWFEIGVRLCWGRPPEGFVEVLYLRTVYQKLPSGFRLNQRRLVSRSGRMAVVRWPAFEDHKPDTLAGALAARKKGLTAYLERDGIDQFM